MDGPPSPTYSEHDDRDDGDKTREREKEKDIYTYTTPAFAPGSCDDTYIHTYIHTYTYYWLPHTGCYCGVVVHEPATGAHGSATPFHARFAVFRTSPSPQTCTTETTPYFAGKMAGKIPPYFGAVDAELVSSTWYPRRQCILVALAPEVAPEQGSAAPK